MKNLVIKTACITLAGVIALSTIIYFIFGAVAPKSLANFYSHIGSYSLAVKYLEKNYLLTLDDNDLVELCFVIDEQKSALLGEEYLTKLVNDSDFSTLCSGVASNAYTLTDADYIVGKLALCHYYNSGIQSALDFSKNWVKDNTYTKFSPFYLLMMNDILTSDLQAIQSVLTELSGSLEGENLTNLQKDLSLVQGLIKG